MGLTKKWIIFPQAKGSTNFVSADTVAVLWPLELSSWNGSLRIAETQEKRK